MKIPKELRFRLAAIDLDQIYRLVLAAVELSHRSPSPQELAKLKPTETKVLLREAQAGRQDLATAVLALSRLRAQLQRYALEVVLDSPDDSDSESTATRLALWHQMRGVIRDLGHLIERLQKSTRGFRATPLRTSLQVLRRRVGPAARGFRLLPKKEAQAKRDRIRIGEQGTRRSA